jgi:DNA-binding HxlR family transcriptional regulator
MQRTQFGDMYCSIARTMHIAGEPWSLLIVRNAMVGTTRFEDHQRMLGVSRKVLTERLNWLVEQGIFERRAYSEHPPRDDYVLTEKGQELADILFAISAWGDRWTAGDAGPPALFRHRTCGELTHAEIRCAHCGEPLHSQDIEVTPGPGADPALLAG